MIRTAQTTVHPAAPPLSRQIATLVTLLVFVLHGLVLQTHIHPAEPQFSGHTVAAAAGQTVPAPLSPSQDRGNCRLCQEMVHAGAYITPVIILAPAVLVFRAAIFQPAPVVRSWSAPAFGWQSRAPPRR
jgi:hypothetical protein